MEKLKRPKALSGKTVKVETGCGNLYITLNSDKDKLFEVFATLGKTGACANAQCEALTRLLTLGLRCGVPVGEYIKELDGIQCPNARMFPKKDRVLSCPDAIAKILREEYVNG